MDAVLEAVARLLRGERPHLAPAEHVRGRRATFQPLRDDSLRDARWAPLG